MKRIIALAAIMAFIMGFAGLAIAQDSDVAKKGTIPQILKRGTLTVGLEAGYLPFEMRNKKGEIVGFDVDMATEMAKAMGVKLKLVNTAWDGIIPALMTKKFDIIMSGMTITQERNLKVNFCLPYIVVGQTVLVASKHEGTITSYRDLNDPKYTIATKLGTTGDLSTKKYIPKAKRNAFEDERVAIMEVVNGKADAFVYDHPMCAVNNAKYPGKFLFLDEPFTFEPLGWAIRKGDPDMLNWMNNFLLQMKGDGTYDKIYRKWFLSNSWLGELQ